MDNNLIPIQYRTKKKRLRAVFDVIKQQMSELIVQCPDELHVDLLLNMNSLIEASFELGKEHGKQEMARSIMAMVSDGIDSATTDDTESA